MDKYLLLTAIDKDSILRSYVLERKIVIGLCLDVLDAWLFPSMCAHVVSTLAVMYVIKLLQDHIQLLV